MIILARFIMKDAMSAAMVMMAAAFLALILPPFSLVGAGALALVTLRQGAAFGLKVLGIAGLASATLAWAIWQQPWLAGSFVLFVWVPVYLIALLLRSSRQLSLTVEITTALGMLGVLVFFAINPDAPAFWRDMLNVLLTPVLGETSVPWLDKIADYMTGIIIAGSVFSLLLALMLGRWWQASLYNPGGFAEEYFALRTHRGFSLAVIIMAAIAAISAGMVGLIASNMAILALTLYGLVGSAVVHVVLKRQRQARFWLPIFYVLLFLVPQMLIPVTLIGLGDSWFNWRIKSIDS
ncbi:MAG: hypothetical protein RQ715_11245 [Methylococcales bacterium]|nr:hypothetical protein [Methylococcales bacterium]